VSSNINVGRTNPILPILLGMVVLPTFSGVNSADIVKIVEVVGMG
jgi:hypothetical protein